MLRWKHISNNQILQTTNLDTNCKRKTNDHTYIPSCVRSSNIDMMSVFRWLCSTVAANLPRFDAADLLTIGMSS